MRYDMMRERYPDIEDLFAEVAQYCHGPAGPDMALGWAERWIARHITQDEQEAVMDKIRRFVDAIKGAGL